MKKITLLVSAFLFVFVANMNAQQSVIDDLDETFDSAEVIRIEAKRVKAALKTLSVDYLINNNPNPDVSTYLQVMDVSMEVVEEFSDEVNYFIGSAAQGNSNIDPSSIQSKASQIEGNEDFVRIKSAELATAIQQNNRNTASQLFSQIRGFLNTQINLAKEIKTEATALKSLAMVYNVRIELVDERSGASVPAGTLPGYAATNQDTGQIYYTDYYNFDTFTNLPAGTYRFDAYDGYFDGASSAIVTLDQSLVGSDGYIVVTLRYWSE
ncbi:hypothetical protein C8N46_104335 [Kordia periserrulae]|uniref:Carboxypeptidase family protein n=1 Tax=Kordia periserrulae TaxID=701523 RepID=A0A2T6C043_9FLAO|nr:hypothetical protein [Kordia periserrulae]PTX61691.1 hypothetical protein C8N46_104335 [Kordia periserrulae]